LERAVANDIAKTHAHMNQAMAEMTRARRCQLLYASAVEAMGTAFDVPVLQPPTNHLYPS